MEEEAAEEGEQGIPAGKRELSFSFFFFAQESSVTVGGKRLSTKRNNLLLKEQRVLTVISYL